PPHWPAQVPRLPSSTVGHVPAQPQRVWLPGKPRPRIPDDPVLWKELHVERGLGIHDFLQDSAPFPTVAVVLLILHLWLGMCSCSVASTGSAGGVRAAINLSTRIFGTTLVCVMLVGIALRAAGSLSSERERQTLDSLLTTPLENRTILVAKWLA